MLFVGWLWAGTIFRDLLHAPGDMGQWIRTPTQYMIFGGRMTSQSSGSLNPPCTMVDLGSDKLTTDITFLVPDRRDDRPRHWRCTATCQAAQDRVPSLHLQDGASNACEWEWGPQILQDTRKGQRDPSSLDTVVIGA